MDQRLHDVLKNHTPFYQQPFLGVLPEDTEEDLLMRITRLNEHGFKSMVLEYKQASAATGLISFDDIWWKKLGFISKICHELGMTYWIQDAAPFPTGAANGFFELDDYKDKSKQFIIVKHMDLRGPLTDALISIDRLMQIFQGDVTSLLKPKSDIPDKLLAVIAMRQRVDCDEYMPDSAIDLTALVKSGVLRYDFTEGGWRVFVIIRSYNGGRRHFMNILDEESVDVQIQAVYEPHYQRLAHELGRTWLGFFYDEPEIGNLDGYVFNSIPGRKHDGVNIPLPWCKTMPDELRKSLGDDYAVRLPALWYDCGSMTRQVRFLFMDAATRLIAKNYNGQVGAWCSSRGIAYMGHVLEDENSHTRLGCGTGHFFRVQEGQHIAGIDLISAQLLPGQDSKGVSWYGASDGDGEFYHYGLAKLASSASHIHPEKKGQSVCELLALTGPAAGTKLRKFIFDHLLVSGINSFVPADSGISIEPVFMRSLNTYVDRMCHLLSGGRHVAPVAVLYHAEAEWCGEYMPFQRVGRELTQNMLDYDVIPSDVFSQSDVYKSQLHGNQLVINEEKYQALIIPYSQFVPGAVVDFISDALESAFPVIFIDKLPDGFCERGGQLPDAVKRCQVIRLSDAPDYLKSINVCDLFVTEKQPYLRHFHYQRENQDLFLFHNEHPNQQLTAVVSLPTLQPIVIYDPMSGQMTTPITSKQGDRTTMQLTLEKYQSILLIAGDFDQSCPHAPDYSCSMSLPAEWRISFESMDSNAAPDPIKSDLLFDIGASDRYERFYGKVIYETSIIIEGELPRYLSLGRVSECARVYLNDEDIGVAVAEPYEFQISDAVHAGTNQLKVEVTTPVARSFDEKVNPVHSLLASLNASPFLPLEPCGLIGPVRVSF